MIDSKEDLIKAQHKDRNARIVGIIMLLSVIAMLTWIIHLVVQDTRESRIVREEKAHLHTLELHGRYRLAIDEHSGYSIRILQGEQALFTDEEGLERVLEVKVEPTGTREMPTISRIIFSDVAGEVMSFEVVTQTVRQRSRCIITGRGIPTNIELGGLVITGHDTRQAVLIRQ